MTKSNLTIGVEDARLSLPELTVEPIGKVDAEVAVPGSKSYTNRAILIAALAEGESVLHNALVSEDPLYMMQAVGRFGQASVTIENQDPRSSAATVRVVRSPGPMRAPVGPIDCGNAGTVIRLLISAAALAKGTTVLTGNDRMQERPMDDVLDGLQQLGVNARSVRNNGCPPVEVPGGRLKGGTARIRGSVSSQFTSSLLVSAPYAEEDVIVEITDEMTSKPYIDITLDIMEAFGVRVEREGYKRFRVRAGQRYQPRTYDVEPDASSMSYFLAAAAVLGGRVRIPGIGSRSKQGDARFYEVLERMGCKVVCTDSYIEVIGGPLKGIDVDMNRMPDLVPTLGVVAAYADGVTHIRNIANLKVKECDRILAVKNELTKMGIRTEATDDSLVVYGGTPRGARIHTYHDHRIAMAFAIAGLKTPGVTIENPGCVTKSFPSFWYALDSLKG